MKSLVLLLVIVALTGCAATAKSMSELSAGSCQAKCRAEHEDSLYDENRCIETLCTAPSD